MLHIAKALERAGKSGNVLAIDGSPLMHKIFRDEIASAAGPGDTLQDAVLMSLIHVEYPDNQIEIAKTALQGVTWDEKLESFVKFSNTDKLSKKKYSKSLIQGLTNRMLMVQSIDLESFPVLESTELSVVVPTEKMVEGLPADLGLGRYTTKQVQASTLHGNHNSLLRNPELLKFL
jgi:hypothetical protein